MNRSGMKQIFSVLKPDIELERIDTSGAYSVTVFSIPAFVNTITFKDFASPSVKYPKVKILDADTLDAESIVEAICIG